MNQKPDDDYEFVDFLKQNQPIPPPAAPDLERRVMSSLSPRRRRLWIVPTAIATGLMTTFVGYRLFQPAELSADAPAIEEFIESNWSNSIQATTSATEASTEYMALVEPTTDQ